jgi:hypothetical protein
MKLRTSFGLILAALCLGAASWNLFAHSIVARIAELEMGTDEKGKAALKKVYATLSTLTKFFPETPDSLLEAAIIPDSLNFNYNGFLKFYHYKDFPEVYKNDDPNMPTSPMESVNADYAIESAVAIIKDSFNPEKEQKKIIKKGFVDSLMTRILIHVAGDVHQPLHASSLFSKYLYDGKIKDGDAGGNMIFILSPYDSNSNNLHSFWDNGLGIFPRADKFPYTEEDKAKIERFAQDLRTAFPQSYFGADVNQLNHTVWLTESARLASQIAYADIDIFPVIRPEYVVIGRRVSRERVTLAGYRLANLLRELFK